MRKLFIFIISILGLSVSSFSQQDPQFSQPYYNQMFFNPASIASRNCISATLSARAQWVGITGAPIVWTFALDMPFAFGKTKQNVIGFGITGYGDYIGSSNNGGLKFSLNYKRCKLGPGDLAIGIDMGLATRKFVNAVWITPTGVPDPSLPNPNAAGEAFDLGIGAYYSADHFYAGISSTHLNAAFIPALNFRFARHMYFNGGGFIPVGTLKNWRLNPNGIIRTDFATMNFDIGINALCFIKEKHGIIFGTSYRFIDAVSFNVGYAVRFKEGTKGTLLIGYNMDLVTSRLNKFGFTSHELVLRFCFPAKSMKFQRVFF